VTTSAAPMQAEDLRGLLDAGAPITVLDIRTRSDRAEWWIPHSIHVDAYDALRRGDPDALTGLDIPVTVPVVAVCRAGVIAQAAARHLGDRGFRAFYLEGGMKAWGQAWNRAEVPIANPDFAVIQVRRTGKGCLSYMIGSRGEAGVVDPAVDPGVYLRLAEERGWRITSLLDTHIHADHVSRGRELAQRTGAQLFLPAQDRAQYAHVPLGDGDQVQVGNATITLLATPGHTPESACFRLDEDVLLTGDTLFLGGVGRPDLEATNDQAAMRARQLHASLKRILALPDRTLILPGHTDRPVPFDGRLVGAPLGVLRKGEEGLGRWFGGAHPSGPDAFAQWILARLPPTPANHGEIVRLNQTGMTPPADLEALEAGANRCAVS
jgi:glyoxylase-like metal-dependent hydrolase (beta-lactamase superfamily II)/rhodanese-related sulfurtransferase